MGIQDVRNAFLSAGEGKLRVTDCHLKTEPDGNNSQRLLINGFHQNGAAFQLDSGPFDPKVAPHVKAAQMAKDWLQKQQAGFRQAPHQAAR